jgi:hypothetical protein
VQATIAAAIVITPSVRATISRLPALSNDA